jgi:glutaredoxin
VSQSSRVTLYTRQGCHLCEDAEALLRRLGYDASLVDVDENPDLKHRYGERVPVIAVDGQDVLEGIIREPDARRALRAAMGLPNP